jgi:hypothetical protein
VFVTLTVYVSITPLAPLCDVGEIETLTLLATFTIAVQLAEPLTPVPFAVTVMLSTVPPIAPKGIVTLRVAVLSLLNAATTTDVGNTLGDHPALSVTVKE